MSAATAGAAARGAVRMRLLVEGPIGPTLARLAAPNILVSAVQTCITVADAIYLGQLGVAPLAAVALVFPIQALMVMMSAGAMGGGVSSSVARALGAGDRGRAEALAAHALVIALVMAAVYTALFAVFARPVFAALGGQGAALDGAAAYAEILFGASVIIWLANTLASVLRGTGNMIVPSAVLIATAVITVVASGTLTLGWFGVPAFGVRGPALAFAGGSTIAAAVLAGYVLLGRAGLRLGLAGLGFRASLFADIMRVGLVACGNALLTIATVAVVTALVGRYGTAALAGYGLGSRLELMLIPLSFGVGGALTAMVGANRGAGEHARARRAAWLGSAAVFAATGALGIVFAIAPDLWIGLFTTDPQAVAFARTYLGIAGPFYGFFGLGMTLYFASQGTGNMVWPFAAGAVRIAVAAGLGAVSALALGLTIEWLFACVAAGLALFGAVIAWSLTRRVWHPDGTAAAPAPT